MNLTLFKALVALVPTCLLFSGSVVLFVRRKTVWSLLQLLGAGCLVAVVLTHVCEALQLVPWMHWGHEIALIITQISGVVFWVSRCFLQDICWIRLQGERPKMVGHVNVFGVAA